MHGRRSGRTGVFDAGGRFEAKGVIGLQHESGGEILRAEACVEMA
jgi:hypothetical protein